MVHLLSGNIDELLLADATDHRLRWPYQLVNLDYCGGLVNAAETRISKRLEAIKILFERQATTSFILLLTLNLRDNSVDEFEGLVDQLEDDLRPLDLEGLGECFAAHRALKQAGLIKLYTPAFLDLVAREHSLVVHAPVLYSGTQTMIHFVVECVRFTAFGAGRVTSVQGRIDLMNLPLLALHTAGEMKEVRLPQIVLGSGAVENESD
jgi:hypothetical protein